MELHTSYVLIAFQQRENIRHFRFKGTSEDKQRLEFIVGVDLALTRTYGIAAQELPLLCRRLLEEKPVLEQSRRSMFSEARMADYARRRDEERQQGEQRRRAYVRPPTQASRGRA